MITKAAFTKNWKEINEAEKLGLNPVDPENEFTEFGFSINDLLSYKVFIEEDVILINFKNGKEEEIELSDIYLEALREHFKKR